MAQPKKKTEKTEKEKIQPFICTALRRSGVQV